VASSPFGDFALANDIVLQLAPGPGNRRNSEATFITQRVRRITFDELYGK